MRLAVRAAPGSNRRCRGRARAAGRSRTRPAARRGSARGGRSQMPIVRSPCTLEWPRTGNRPAPGLPMLPWAKARLATSLMVATALRCWVRPIAQQNTVRVGVARASARASVICARVSPVVRRPPVPVDGAARARVHSLEAGGVLLDEVVVEGVPLAPAATPMRLEQREVAVDLDRQVQVGELGAVADHAAGVLRVLEARPARPRAAG